MNLDKTAPEFELDGVGGKDSKSESDIFYFFVKIEYVLEVKKKNQYLIIYNFQKLTTNIGFSKLDVP